MKTTALYAAVIHIAGWANAMALPANTLHVTRDVQKMAKFRQIAELGQGTFLENIAVRANGEVLATRLDKAVLMAFNPTTGESIELIPFPGKLATAGIVEMEPDIFAVVAGGFNLSNPAAAKDTFTIHKVNLTRFDMGKGCNIIEVSQLAAISGAKFLNGLTFAPPSTLYAADVFGGTIYDINIRTGKSRVAANNSILRNTTAVPFGVNGVRYSVSERSLFFTNSGQNVLGRFPVDAVGTFGTPELVANNTLATGVYDDFMRMGNGEFLVATNFGNTISRISKDGKIQRVVVGSRENTDVGGPTAVALGRRLEDRDILYAVTSGDLLGPVNNQTVGAQLLAIDLNSMQ